MKSLLFSLLIILLSLLVSPSTQRRMRAPKTILQLLDELSVGTWQTIKSEDSKLIIGIGGTGVGKSTALNLLAGHPLQVVSTTDNKFKAYKVSENYSDYSLTTPIGMTKISQTSLPIHVPSIRDKTIQFFDTAGGSDTRLFINEVVNYYGYEKMFQLAKNVKIVIFIDQLGLKNNKLEQTLIELNLADDFTDHVGIVITKVSSRNDSNEEVYLRELIYNITEEVVRKGIKGAEVIKCAYIFDHIAFFSSPQRLQKLNRTLEYEREQIQKMIDELQFAYQDEVRRFLNIESNYILQQKIKETQVEFFKVVIEKVNETEQSAYSQLKQRFANDSISKRQYKRETHELIKKVYGGDKGPAKNYIPFLEFLDEKTEKKNENKTGSAQ